MRTIIPILFLLSLSPAALAHRGGDGGLHDLGPLVLAALMLAVVRAYSVRGRA